MRDPHPFAKARLPLSPGLMAAFPPQPAIDLPDLERRVADIEERLRREDQERAAKGRLRELGLVFPCEKQEAV